jgi:hypothetical protein
MCELVGAPCALATQPSHPRSSFFPLSESHLGKSVLLIGGSRHGGVASRAAASDASVAIESLAGQSNDSSEATSHRDLMRQGA